MNNPLDALSGAHTRNTVVVLGASYAGNRAVNVLVQHLPPSWRVIVLERNTHANRKSIIYPICSSIR